MDKEPCFSVTVNFKNRGQTTALYNFLEDLPDCIYDGGALGYAFEILERAIYNLLPEQQAIWKNYRFCRYASTKRRKRNEILL